jgi:hypothetical protein
MRLVAYGAVAQALPVPDLGPEIEPFALSQPVVACDPSEKSGAQAFRNFILSRIGGADVGISRPCTTGKPSDHHVGMAWDWGVLASVPADAQRAEAVLSWLLAPDQYGNPAALFRRAGLTYVIWNKQYWSSKNQQWLPYTGASPHEDHVHFSFGQAGALGHTSLYPWIAAGAPDGGFVVPPPVQLQPRPSPWPGILAFGAAAALGWAGTWALRRRRLQQGP